MGLFWPLEEGRTYCTDTSGNDIRKGWGIELSGDESNGSGPRPKRPRYTQAVSSRLFLPLTSLKTHGHCYKGFTMLRAHTMGADVPEDAKEYANPAMLLQVPFSNPFPRRPAGPLLPQRSLPV